MPGIVENFDVLFESSILPKIISIQFIKNKGTDADNYTRTQH